MENVKIENFQSGERNKIIKPLENENHYLEL